MRLKLLKVIAILLLAGSSHGRPQRSEPSGELEPEVERHDEEGWLPVRGGRDLPQDQNPVDEDVPEIVEGNSRYKGDRDRKSYENPEQFRRGMIHERRNSKRLEFTDFDKNNSRGSNLGRVSVSESNLTDILTKLRALSNVRSAVSPHSTVSSDARERATNVVNFVRIRPQTSVDSTSTSEKYESGRVVREKAGNFIKIRSKPLKITSTSRIRDPVYEPDSYTSKSGSNRSKNTFVPAEVAPLSSQSRLEGKLSGKKATKGGVRIEPQIDSSLGDLVFDQRTDRERISNVASILRKVANDGAIEKSNAKENDVLPDFKNWPNGAVENVEDLYNYDKYTSFHGIDGHTLDEVSVTSDSLNYVNEPMNHGIVEKGSDENKKKPPILIFQHSLPPKYPTANYGPNVITIYDPEPLPDEQTYHEENANWQQIPAYGFHHSVFPGMDADKSPFNDFASILENLQPNRPVSNEHQDAATNEHDHYGANVNDLVDVEDYTQHQLQDEDLDYDREPILQNPNSEATEGGSSFETANVDETIANGVNYPVPERPIYGPQKKPSFNPTSIVSQNTVVHIINKGNRRPNVTVTEMKVPDHGDTTQNVISSSESLDRINSSMPNVHITFATQEGQVGGNGSKPLVSEQKVPEVTYGKDTSCPTITINSYTTINNTMESKEGCTDLNIVINSHVVNTNFFQPGSSTSVNVALVDDDESDRTPGNNESSGTYGTSSGNYGSSSGNYGSSGASYGNYPSEGGIPPQNDYSDFSAPIDDGQSIGESGNNNQQSPSSSFLQVFQETEINLSSYDSPYPEEAFDLPVQDEAFDSETGNGNGASDPAVVQDDPIIAPEELDMSPSDSAIGSGDPGIVSDPVVGPSDPGVMADPVVSPGGGDATGGSTPVSGIPSVPSLGGIGGVMDDPGTGVVAADSPLSAASGGSSGLQLPSLSNPLSGISGQIPGLPGGLGSQSQNGPLSNVGSTSSVLDDDEEDDDDFGLFPSGFMESMSSFLPYFTLLNPLNLGLFSFAISPFAVAAAGILSFAAFISPLAFPVALDFGRAADRVIIRVRPNVEEVVNQSIHKYENWNDWKSRRKKRER